MKLIKLEAHVFKNGVRTKATYLNIEHISSIKELEEGVGVTMSNGDFYGGGGNVRELLVDLGSPKIEEKVRCNCGSTNVIAFDNEPLSFDRTYLEQGEMQFDNELYVSFLCECGNVFREILKITK